MTDAPMETAERGPSPDNSPFKDDVARACPLGREEPINQGGLAGPVRSEERRDTDLQREREILVDTSPAAIERQATCFQDAGTIHAENLSRQHRPRNQTTLLQTMCAPLIPSAAPSFSVEGRPSAAGGVSNPAMAPVTGSIAEPLVVPCMFEPLRGSDLERAARSAGIFRS